MTTVVQLITALLLINIQASQTQVCDSGWTYLNNYCYRFMNHVVNHAGAVRGCRSNGAELASIHNDAENNLLFNMNGYLSTIGGVRFGNPSTFRWIDGTPVDYTGPLENHHLAGPYSLSGNSRRWVLDVFTNTGTYLCKKFAHNAVVPTKPCDARNGWSFFENKCYKFFSESGNQAFALSKCNQNNASLVSIHSDNEYYHAMARLGENRMTAHTAGIMFLGTVTWMDGSPTDYHKVLPNSHGSGCLAFSSFESKLKVVDCTQHHRFVCKSNAILN